MMTMEPEAVIAVQKALADRPDSVPTARTITVPLMAVAGGEDVSSTPAEMEVLAQSARNAEYHLLIDAGHFAAVEQPERAGSLLRKFLDRCSE
jgi:pimeloyl-ACP methyl ester carboxylesterase